MTERPQGEPGEATGPPPPEGATRDEPAIPEDGTAAGRQTGVPRGTPGGEAPPRPETAAAPVQGEGRPAEPRPDADPGRRPEPEPAAEPRLGLVDWVYGVIFAPRATFARLAAMERPPLGLLLTVAIVVTAASGLVQGAAVARDLAVPVLPGQDPLLPPDVARSPGVALAMAVGLAALRIATLFVGAGFLHLLADLVGGRGSGANLLAALALALLPPNLIGIPLEALASRLAGVGGPLRELGTVAMLVWSVVLLYHALRATKRLSRADALIVIFVPWLAVTALAVLVAVTVAGVTLAVGG
ncbi:MAG TPA: YIP1 family protein [Thermaerobacter sp.]